MTKLTKGGVEFRFGSKSEKVLVNRGPSALMRQTLYKYFVAAGGFNHRFQASASPAIGRFSAMRYDKNALLPGLWQSASHWNITGLDAAWTASAVFEDPDMKSAKILGPLQALTLTNDSAAIGSVGVNPSNGTDNPYGSYYPPNGFTGRPFTSFLDLPGSSIGNKFKHPVGRSNLFNEVGQVALSQGNLSVLGVFDPPENQAYHYAYQVYYAKSGGTGVIDTGVGSQTLGTLTAGGGSDDLFTDAAAGGHFVVGDVGRYIAIREPGGRNGTYEITAYVDANNVRVDTKQVNEAVGATENNLDWTLRDGPIAEYFVRRRRYNCFDEWGISADTTNVFSRPMYGNHDIVVWSGRLPNNMFTSYTRKVLHDRGAHWWVLCDMRGYSRSYPEFAIYRWMDQGPTPFDPTLADGDITNMPVGVDYFRDMDIDKNNKIWMTCDDVTPAVGYSAHVIDPYPSGASINPEWLRGVSKQASLAAAGLPTATALAVHCDNDNGDVTHGRTWVACGDDGSVNGGLWYSEDGGVTMEGLVHEKSALTGTDSWNVAADGVTVTNPAANGSLTTEIVAGEWVTFQDGSKDESKRQVASVTDDDTLVLTAATTFGGAQSGLTMKKGAINSAHIGIYFDPNDGSRASEGGQNVLGIDHDTSGILYWTPADYLQGVCRFDPGSTNPVEFIDRISLLGAYGPYDRVNNVGVSRMPDPVGLGTSIWHDNVWVGGGLGDGMSRVFGWESYHNSGVATVTVDEFEDAGRNFTSADVGKYIRIYNSASGNNGTYRISSINGVKAVLDSAITATESNLGWELFGLTRYVYASGTNAFPNVVYVSWGLNEASLLQDRVNGDIAIRYRGTTSNPGGSGHAGVSKVQTMVPTTDPDCGVTYDDNLISAIYTYYDGERAGLSEVHMQYDDLGMGTIFTSGYGPKMGTETNLANRSMGRHWAPLWNCLLWDGSGWQHGPLNSHLANVDFAGVDATPGPHAEFTPAVGYGLRRAMEIPASLEFGLSLRFDQAGGATDQEDEFVIDENTTYLAVMGRAKDNTMTAEWQASVNHHPTVVRLDEVAADVGAPWTEIGGWDGGYVDSANDQAFPLFCRGLAEGNDAYWANNSTPEYFNFAHAGSNPANPQYMASLRIHDALITAGDLSISNSGGDGLATSATYDFDTDDVGKTIRVEGANTAGNNTSKVITGVNNPGGGAGTSQAVLDSEWADPADTNEPLTWRLRVVPEVSYVAFSMLVAEEYWPQTTWKLLSSRDGVNWDTVKTASAVSGVATDVLVSSYRDPGIYACRLPFAPSYEYDQDAFMITTGDNRISLVFDLTTDDVAADQRRRTFWKVVRGPASNVAYYPMCVQLLDANYAPVMSSGHMLSDRLDPLWYGCAEHGLKAVMHESAGAVTITQSTSVPGDFGDIVNEAGAGYWLQNDTDLKVYANTSKVTAASAPFTWQDVGRKLRVPAADVTLGVDETYSGFLTIVSVESSSEATVERTFESQATGAFQSVQDNGGGQVQINASGHTLANGDAVTIDGAAGTWDGHYTVSNVVAGVSFEIGVAYTSGTDSGSWDKGQTGLTWATLNFGALDRVRFDDTTTIYTHLGRPLAVMTYKIIDVPSTNQIQVEYMDIPDAVTVAFAVERDFDNVYDDPAYNNDFEDGFNAYICRRTGIFGVNDEGQFNVIDEDAATRSAASGADADGDGWADDITITGHNVPGAVGDWILLYNPATQADARYRRWYKIKTITPGANTVLTTYEDEIPPGETFMWKIARKRDMKIRATYAVVAGREPM